MNTSIKILIITLIFFYLIKLVIKRFLKLKDKTSHFIDAKVIQKDKALPPQYLLSVFMFLINSVFFAVILSNLIVFSWLMFLFSLTIALYIFPKPKKQRSSYRYVIQNADGQKVTLFSHQELIKGYSYTFSHIEDRYNFSLFNRHYYYI